MGLNLGPVIDNYSWMFMPLQCAKRKHTATRTVDKHTASRELVFKTADMNGSIPSQCHLLLLFTINLCKNPCAM